MSLLTAFVLSLAALSSQASDAAAPVSGRDLPIGCSHAKTAYLRDARSSTPLKNIEDPAHDRTDVQHYRLDFEVDPNAELISGSTTMTVASRIEDLESFRFWLNRSMAISSVEVDGQAVGWARSGEAVVDVELNRSYDPGEVFDLEVVYSGRPIPDWFFSRQGGAPIISTLSQPWHASEWWAVKDDNNDKATGEMLVTVPSDLTVVSNGVLVETENVAGNKRRFHWSTGYETSPYLFAFSTTVYNTFSETFFFTGGVMPVDFFIYPQSDTTDNRNGWRLTVDMLSTFEEMFGPYPFRDEKYAIYQFPFGGGMEHQTATGQGGNYAFSQYLSSHELAHQWWGDMVTCASWHDIWLNEGFATYSTALWLEHASGASDPDARSAYMEARRPQQLDGSVYVYDITDSARIFSSNYSYSKGAWVVHMLRGVVGDADFFNILAAYRERYEFSTATTEDFRAVAEDVWGGDLQWFFDQWVYGGGAPGYRYGWQEHEVNGQRYLEISLEQSQSDGVFRMPIEIATRENGQNRSYSVWNDARVENLLIPVSGPVQDVDLDPDDWILSRFASRGPAFDGPPKVVEIDPPPNASHPTGEPFSMTVTFHRDVVTDESDFSLRRSDGFESAIDVSYDAATYTATVTTAEPLARGRYRLIVSDRIVDSEDGMALDGELENLHGESLPSGDGLAGGDAIIEFTSIGTRRPGNRLTPSNSGAGKRQRD